MKRLAICVSVTCLALLLCAGANAQEKRHRKLAPGVMKEVPPAPEYDDSVARHNVVELLAIEPKLDWAKNVPVRRDVWGLDFKFKPVRMVPVDLPQPSGKMARKLVWYMVYSVTNTGIRSTRSNSPTASMRSRPFPSQLNSCHFSSWRLQSSRRPTPIG